MWRLIVGLLGDIALPLAFVGWSAYGFVVFAIPAVRGMGWQSAFVYSPNLNAQLRLGSVAPNVRFVLVLRHSAWQGHGYLFRGERQQ